LIYDLDQQIKALKTTFCSYFSMIFTIQKAHIYRKIVINKYGNLSNYLIDCNLDFINHLQGEVMS
jgi:hypothetical protein